MKLDDLKLGDILFYFNTQNQNLTGAPDQDYAVTHVAIVSHVGNSPWVSHLTEHGLVFNAVKTRSHTYTGFHYLAYRLKYDSDSHFGVEAAQLARMWCIANKNASLKEKAPPSNGAFNDTFLPTIVVPNTYSYFKSHSAAIRSSSFGCSAIRYVTKLQRYKAQRQVPAELINKGGMFCSMFVASCYQAAFGTAISGDMLAVDAQTTLPWTLYHYMQDRACWKNEGEVDFYHSV